MLYSTQAWQFFLCNAIMWNIKEMRTEVAIYPCEESCSLCCCEKVCTMREDKDISLLPQSVKTHCRDYLARI